MNSFLLPCAYVVLRLLLTLPTQPEHKTTWKFDVYLRSKLSSVSVAFVTLLFVNRLHGLCTQKPFTSQRPEQLRTN